MWFHLRLCSASVLLRQAEELAAKYPNTIPVTLDAGSQEGHLDSLVKDHDLVIRYGMSTIFCYKQKYKLFNMWIDGKCPLSSFPKVNLKYLRAGWLILINSEIILYYMSIMGRFIFRFSIVAF